MPKTCENIQVNINVIETAFTPTVRFNGKHHKKKNPFHMVLRNHLYYYILSKLFNQSDMLGEEHYKRNFQRCLKIWYNDRF